MAAFQAARGMTVPFLRQWRTESGRVFKTSSLLTRQREDGHYGGAENPYAAIKVIETWSRGFNFGNCVK
jgi:hypothetical protein